MDFDFNSLFKKKTELHFNDNMIVSFGKILNNNFFELYLQKIALYKKDSISSFDVSI